jgi:hypothetical protein
LISTIKLPMTLSSLKYYTIHPSGGNFPRSTETH